MDFHRSTWARQLDQVMLEISLARRLERISSKTKQRIENILDKLLLRKLTGSHPEVIALKNRLNRLRKYITACLYNLQVPPDNNAAARGIRMIKLKSKISGTFRSRDGSYRFSVRRTIVDSAIKQKLNPFLLCKIPRFY
jgi:transposase